MYKLVMLREPSRRVVFRHRRDEQVIAGDVYREAGVDHLPLDYARVRQSDDFGGI